ncbi:STAS domain-containing protein [Rubritalea tangerina]|uniref:STAS domain-containing protein n=1 Tax=Rubritalea tangerina TaxID=430798 RepID=A0ABW4Z9B8_9BACT
MSNSNIILAGNVNGLGWVRCEGKGSFMNSPKLKSWADDQLQAGIVHIVIDLEECTGMDSTFMGTMAGLAMRLVKTTGGLLEIASADKKNSQSLDDLGLSSLMTINPESPEWAGQEFSVRKSLTEYGLANSTDRTQHVFDAHKTLVEADESNTDKFSTVLDCLEAELLSRDPSNEQ